MGPRKPGDRGSRDPGGKGAREPAGRGPRGRRPRSQRHRRPGRRRRDALIWDRPEPESRRAGVSRASIAATALRISDAEGFEAVSMRRIASELGVGTMTLYHYVHSKAELVTLMGDAIMGEVLIPDGEMAADWRRAITEIAHRTRAVFTRHPWAFEVTEGGADAGPNAMRHFEQSLAAVAGTGLPEKDRLDLITMVDDYVFGVVARDARIREWTGGKSVPGAEDWPEGVAEFFAARLESGDYPNLERFAGTGDVGAKMRRVSELVFDDGRFDRGLKRILDGISVEVDARRD